MLSDQHLEVKPIPMTMTPYEKFMSGLNAKESKRQYPRRLDHLLRFLNLKGNLEERINGLYDFIQSQGNTGFENQLLRFINFQKERIEKEAITEATFRTYIKALKHFCVMNDILNINWKKLSKGMPQEVHSPSDRIPTREEIQKLLEFPDMRIKPIVLIMLSSGIRVGSWDYLRWKHVIPIKDNESNHILGAKIILTNTKIRKRQYYSFITKEAYLAIKEYIDFRQLHGEQITGESWLIRDTWQKIDRKHDYKIGLAQYPKKLNSSAIRNLIYDAWLIQGIREKLDQDPADHSNKKRHEFKSTHCFRKFFETTTQKVMNHNNIKLLMDHSMGESANYYRPLEDELLTDYLKAIDLLTVDETQKLRKEIEYYKIEKSKIDNVMVQIEEMKKKLGLNF